MGLPRGPGRRQSRGSQRVGMSEQLSTHTGPGTKSPGAVRAVRGAGNWGASPHPGRGGAGQGRDPRKSSCLRRLPAGGRQVGLLWLTVALHLLPGPPFGAALSEATEQGCPPWGSETLGKREGEALEAGRGLCRLLPQHRGVGGHGWEPPQVPEYLKFSPLQVSPLDWMSGPLLKNLNVLE